MRKGFRVFMFIGIIIVFKNEAAAKCVSAYGWYGLIQVAFELAQCD